MVLFAELGTSVVIAYQDFLASLPSWGQNFINLFFMTLVFVLYSVMIWKFYRFIAHKNIMSLNLNKYNRSEHPIVAKTLAGLFFFIEYVIFLPLLTLLWFGVFTIFLVLLTNGIELDKILMVSTVIIASIRMTAYYKEDLSRDIAKLIPFTLLGAAITQINSFSFEKMLGQLFAIPHFFQDILSYLLFIFVMELLLRFVETIFVASGIHNEKAGEVEE